MEYSRTGGQTVSPLHWKASSALNHQGSPQMTGLKGDGWAKCDRVRFNETTVFRVQNSRVAKSVGLAFRDYGESFGGMEEGCWKAELSCLEKPGQ